jgi:hypothetical protein
MGFDADQDCSAVAPRAKAQGVEFCCRYYKNLSPREALALSKAGLKIVSIWETTAERALQGAAAGTEDGNNARDAGAALLQPEGSAIYATADFGEVATQDPAVMAYLSAFKTALGGEAKLGVYGEGAVCQAALGAGIADYTWVAGGRGMRGTVAFLASGRATIVQDVGDAQGLGLGISIDSDTAAGSDYGGWSLAPAPAAA